MKTWHVERGVYAASLLTVWALQFWGQFTDKAAIGGLILMAGFLCFAGINSIMHRVREKREVLGLRDITVECTDQLTGYQVYGNILMLAFGIWMGSWLTIVACIHDLIYSHWRKWYRKRNPLKVETSDAHDHTDVAVDRNSPAVQDRP